MLALAIRQLLGFRRQHLEVVAHRGLHLCSAPFLANTHHLKAKVCEHAFHGCFAAGKDVSAQWSFVRKRIPVGSSHNRLRIVEIPCKGISEHVLPCPAEPIFVQECCPPELHKLFKCQLDSIRIFQLMNAHGSKRPISSVREFRLLRAGSLSSIRVRKAAISTEEWSLRCRSRCSMVVLVRDVRFHRPTTRISTPARRLPTAQNEQPA